MSKHKLDSGNIELSEKEMAAVLTDVLLMEAYVNERMVNVSPDSLVIIKKSFYSPILKYHKADSSAFYSTFNYYQSHPKEFAELLTKVDSNLNKIVPLDTTVVNTIVETPKNIDKLLSFREQEEAMRIEYLKKNSSLQKFKKQKSEKKEKN